MWASHIANGCQHAKHHAGFVLDKQIGNLSQKMICLLFNKAFAHAKLIHLVSTKGSVKIAVDNI